MKITAAVLEEFGGNLEIQDLEVEQPQEGEVLVRVVASGICHTDLAASGGVFKSPTPLILGHEGAGVVETVGAGVVKVQPGDHVVLSQDSCRECRRCRSGEPMHCAHFNDLNFGSVRANGESGYERHGEPVYGRFAGSTSFTTHSLLSQHSVIKVPADAPLELLGPFACAVQTGAGAVFNALRPEPGSSLVVFGAGAVGLCSVMAANLTAATRIVAVDVVQSRLDLATELGATHTINSREDGDVVERILEITEGRGADYAIDLTGLTEVVGQAVAALCRTGTCLLVAVPAVDVLPLPFRDVMRNGKDVRGMIGGESVPELFIPQLIELFQQGRLPVDRLITRFPLDQINEAIAATERGEVIKAVLDIG